MSFNSPQFAPQNVIMPLVILIKGEYMQDIVGQRFGKWTLIDYKGRDKKSEQLYECKCDCGTRKLQRLSTLIGKQSVQCKTCRMNDLNKVDDLLENQFGSWTVIDKFKNIERNEWYYKCLCVCSTIRNIAGHQLKSGRTTQCHRCRNKTHGMSYTDTFRIWTGILRRCLNPNFKAYKYYGGRGIKVCEHWLKFENFLNDMGHRPPKLQIDRIDNNGNYEPSNCRWVTSAVNNSNRKIKKEIKEN